MPVELIRIDDRLIHGQVVVGWAQHLNLQRIILVHDEVAGSEWEQELYRLGVPPEMEVIFTGVREAADRLAEWRAAPERAVVLVADVVTVRRMVELGAAIGAVNMGGLHHQAGRTQRLRYVYLTRDDEAQLRELAARGIVITAQDVPTARPIPLDDVLRGAAS